MSSPNKLTLNTNPLQKRSDKKTKDMGYSPFKMKGPSLYTSPNKQITRAKMKKAGKKALEYTFNPVKTATDIYDYVTSKGETVGKKVAKTVKSAARDYAPKVSRKKAEESPAKSLLGLGKDNKAVKARNKVTRQENKEARKEHREAKKGDRKQHKADKKQYREDKKQYKKDKGSSKGGVLGTKYLSKKEMRYFMDNKKDYHEDWGKVHGGKLLSEKTTKLKGAHTKKGKERRKTNVIITNNTVNQ